MPPDDVPTVFALIDMDAIRVKGVSTDTILTDQSAVPLRSDAVPTHDPATQPPDDSNTKEGVPNTVILLRRHQEEGGRAGPGGRPELPTPSVIHRLEPLLVTTLMDEVHEVLLLRINRPGTIGKGDLGPGDTPRSSRSATAPLMLRSRPGAMAIRAETEG